MNLHKNLSLFIFALIASPSVMAGIIFDNGAPDGSRGYWSDLDQGQEMADNFILGAGNNTITGFSWSGSYYRTNTPVTVDNFTIRIFADSSGIPTAPLLSFNVGNTVNRINSGVDDSTWSLDIYNYTASIAATTLTAGTTYWLSIVNNTAGATDDWLWENSTPNGSNAFRSSASGTWAGYSSELAFQLNDDAGTTIPEPATLILMGLGLAGLGFARRRRLNA